MGISVRPKGRAGVRGGNTALMNGGPAGSRAMIVLIRAGRKSPRIQPYCPDWEWVRRITGCREDFI